jgi:hypothetical protein
MSTIIHHSIWVFTYDVHQSSRAARDQIHVLFFVCAVNPADSEAQAMSGAGVGSEEMKSILVNNDQLPALQLMLNDIKTKLACVIPSRKLL